MPLTTRQQPAPLRALRCRLRVLTVAVLLVPVLLMSAPAVAGKLIGTKGLRNGAVTTAKLHGSAVTASKLQAGAVTQPAIRPGAVTGAALADGSVGLADLAPGLRSFRSGWVYAGTTTDETVDASALKVAPIVEPRITQAVIDGGEVEVYFRYGSDVFPLPYTSNAGSEPNTISYLLRPGQIRITRFGFDNTPVNLPGALQYRYVITPPTATTPAARHAARRTPAAASSAR